MLVQDLHWPISIRISDKRPDVPRGAEGMQVGAQDIDTGPITSSKCNSFPLHYKFPALSLFFIGSAGWLLRAVVPGFTRPDIPTCKNNLANWEAEAGKSEGKEEIIGEKGTRRSPKRVEKWDAGGSSI